MVMKVDFVEHFPFPMPYAGRCPQTLSIGLHNNPPSPFPFSYLVHSMFTSVHHTFQSWRWRWHCTLKCWYPTTTLHGVTPQKTMSSHSSMLICIWKVVDWI